MCITDRDPKQAHNAQTPAGRLTDLKRRRLRDRFAPACKAIRSALMIQTRQEYDVHSALKRIPAGASVRPGFASTAAYFVRRAQKEVRDHDRRQRLLDVADFYFTLARIIPNMLS